MSEITISKVQAIRHVNFDMPENEGGVRLFVGPNGAGKSTAINCLNALLGRKIALFPSDNAPKGLIEGMGRSITIQKRTSAKGDVEVASLEGRFDFSDLVEPSIKDPVARNKARIRSLVGLTAGEATIADFYELFGGEQAFAQLMSAQHLPESGDVLDLADAVKKAVESVALAEEARLASEEAKWQVAVTDSKGHNPKNAPPTVAVLANEYAAAKEAASAAQERINAKATAIEHNETIAAKIAMHNQMKPKVDMDRALDIVKSTQAAVAELEAKLATARATLDEAKRRFGEAHQWEQRLGELESSLMQVEDELPDIEPLRAAEAAALANLESAEAIKSRYESAVKAKQLGESVVQRRERAEFLRGIAKRVHAVVTSKLPDGCPLQVKGGMLSAYYDARDTWVAFDELSEGERWKASLHIAIAAVGPGGVIPVKQEAWQSLDTEAKDWVAQQCSEAKVWVISGEVGDGDLRVESYAPSAS